MAVLSRGIEQGAREALARVEQLGASASPNGPARQQLQPVLEALRRMILTLQAQARTVSAFPHQQDGADAARRER